MVGPALGSAHLPLPLPTCSKPWKAVPRSCCLPLCLCHALGSWLRAHTSRRGRRGGAAVEEVLTPGLSPCPWATMTLDQQHLPAILPPNCSSNGLSYSSLPSPLTAPTRVLHLPLSDLTQLHLVNSSFLISLHSPLLSAPSCFSQMQIPKRPQVPALEQTGKSLTGHSHLGSHTLLNSLGSDSPLHGEQHSPAAK